LHFIHQADLGLTILFWLTGSSILLFTVKFSCRDKASTFQRPFVRNFFFRLIEVRIAPGPFLALLDLTAYSEEFLPARVPYPKIVSLHLPREQPFIAHLV
jgi:hypothetical protein